LFDPKPQATAFHASAIKGNAIACGFGSNDWVAGVEERGTSDEPPVVRSLLSIMPI